MHRIIIDQCRQDLLTHMSIIRLKAYFGWRLADAGVFLSCQVRFILPVLPVFNIAAAAALDRIWNNKHKAAWVVPSIAVSVLLVGTACATALIAAVSRHNYPGGHALHELHQWQQGSTAPQDNSLGALKDGSYSVHVDVLPAMTGVSRFGEHAPPWHYSKASFGPLSACFVYLLYFCVGLHACA